MITPYYKVPPVIAVIWFDNRFWLARDTSHLSPDQAAKTKTSYIEFLPYLEGEDLDGMNLSDRFMPRQPRIRFTVNNETLYDGPGMIERFGGRRRPHIQHYRIIKVRDENFI